MLDSTSGTIFILLSGIFTVVGGILVLRLHAFLAIVAAAIVVALLTPHSARQRYLVESKSFAAQWSVDNQYPIEIEGAPSAGLTPGTKVLLMASSVGEYLKMGEATIVSADKNDVSRVFAETSMEVDSFLGDAGFRAIFPSELKLVEKQLKSTIGARIASGFGKTAESVGILIAMAAIVGKCLLDSGAADRIVRTMLKLCGERGTPLAFMLSGFFLGIPVFFDTVFYLMIPLGKAMRVRTGKNYLLYVLTIICGATMAHSLIPPTPGPLVVAEEFGVNLGVMILVGSVVALIAATFGYLYAAIVNARFDLPLRETPDFSLEELEKSMQVDESTLPGFWLASLPILIPVILITAETLVSHRDFPIQSGPTFTRIVQTLGDKNMALIVAAVAAMAVLIRQKRSSFEQLSKPFQSALASAGVIILITAAGGAFGLMLRETGVSDLIKKLPETSPQMICTLGFLVTAAIRTAQGSATVAMITAAGILSGIALDQNLPFHPVYLACAIGAGSKPIAWMNDSGFWVMTKMSGMTETEGLKFITPMTSSMGVIGLLVVLLGVTFFPNL